MLNAGNSAYAACGAETGSHGVGQRPGPHSFAGAIFVDNEMWTGPRAHFDIGMAVGTRAWWGQLVDFGTGVVFRNTFSSGNVAWVNSGISVSAMQNATVEGTNVLFAPMQLNSSR